MPRSGIAESYGSSVFFSFFKNLHTVFHSGCTSSARGCSLFSIPSPAFVFVYFLMIVTLTNVRWYLIVVLICIILVISVVKHLFVCLLDICMSLEKCLVRSFCPFFSWVVFLWLCYMRTVCIF